MYAEPPVPGDPEKIFRRVKAAFGQRRKTLSNALKPLGVSKDMIEKALGEAKVDPGRRGETLSLKEFASIADGFAE